MNIILACLIIYIVYSIIRNPQLDNFDDTENNEYVSDYIKPKNKKYSKNGIVKPYLLQSQFSNYYRDVITAFNNMVPSDKQIFNLDNIPLDYSEPRFSELDELINKFIEEINDNINKNVNGYLTKNNGWDEPLKQQEIKSGWDKVQESLGLKGSIYKESIPNGNVKFVILQKLQKYETNEQIKYKAVIVITKKKAPEQMLVTVSFVINKNEDSDVVIESIFIDGYLSNNGSNLSSDTKETEYCFDSMERNNMTSINHVKNKIVEKKIIQEKNLHNKNKEFDNPIFSNELPSPNEYDGYNTTLSITKDLENKQIWT